LKSDTNDVQQLFQDRRQYRVPFYQRAYVWVKEEQWEPLWNDIQTKAESRTDGETLTPHFLGAIVLEPQPRRGLKGVETYNIIDGQQRITTLQYFLAALLISSREESASALVPLIDGCVWNPNPNTMENPAIERFKVWPTFRDRNAYRIAMQAASRNELNQGFPLSFTQGGTLKKIGVDHPAALEAIWFFCDQIEKWCGEDAEIPEGRILKLERLTEAVLRDLRVVTICLEDGDDAQVIFETLNGRGAELHATDLIRNFIFMRADREEADSQDLYDTFWIPFESTFWTEGQRRGRLKRPRLEWFVQTALQAELSDLVEVGRLYTDYRRYVNQKPPIKAEDQLRMLAKHSANYHQLTSGSGTEPIARFGQRIGIWDVSPTHALALKVASIGLPEELQSRIFDDIVSYIVRRAMCGLTTKNYNNVFLALVKSFSNSDTAESFGKSLSLLKGDASRWPTDDEFRVAWLRAPAHERLGDSARVRTVLSELENGLRSARTEAAFAPGEVPLDVDHILPDKWYAYWPMDGKAVTAEEAVSAIALSYGIEKLSPLNQAIVNREQLKATIGNLTLVHYGINRSLQNGDFADKRKAFFAESNLQLNRFLMVAEHWGEDKIQERGNALFEVARTIWRGPA